MKRDIRVYVEDILESIEKIEEYTKPISEEDFYKNTQIQDAVLRRLAIIGEAVKNIPQEFRDKYPESIILDTDFGQADNPSPVEGLASYVRSMLKEGITEKEINLMVRVNPCELLKVKRRHPEVFLAKTTKKEEKNEK